MDSPILSTYLDMTKAAKKLAQAHDGVRAAIAEHADKAAKNRADAHAALVAENGLKEIGG